MKKLAISMFAAALSLMAAEWSVPVEVRHDSDRCLTYRARLDGSYLVVQAAIDPTWHTFSMDNKVRAQEKLAGKKSLGIDQPTEITLQGLAITGPWYQTPPRDFSKPDLNWFSWGFEKQATFAAKVKRTGGAAKLGLRGQACTETTCKNIDIEIPVPPGAPSGAPALDLKQLELVRTK